MDNYKLFIVSLVLLVISILPHAVVLTGDTMVTGLLTAKSNYIEVASTEFDEYYFVLGEIRDSSLKIKTSTDSSFIITNQQGCNYYFEGKKIGNQLVLESYDNTKNIYFNKEKEIIKENVCIIILKEAEGVNKISYRILN